MTNNRKWIAAGRSKRTRTVLLALSSLALGSAAFAAPGGKSSTSVGMNSTSIVVACASDTAAYKLLSRNFFGSFNCGGAV